MKPFGIQVCDATTPAPLTRPTECLPVGRRARVVPLYIYQNDIFEEDKIFSKNSFRKISFPYQSSDQNNINLTSKLT